MSPTSATTPMPPAHAFLLRVACLLNAYGTPAHRLERELLALAASLDVVAAFHSTPTGILASFGAGNDERVHLVRVEPGEIDLGRLSDFDEVIDKVRTGALAVDEGLRRVEAIEARRPRFSFPYVAAGFGMASAGAASLFGGGQGEVLLSAILGGLIFVLARVLSRNTSSVGTLEPLAAFLAAMISLDCQERGWIADHRVATLASLIVLVPGLTLTLSLVELSTGHLVSGAARFARAMIVFLTILFGVALAWKLGGTLYAAEPQDLVPLGELALYLAIATTPLAFAILFQIRRREWPEVVLAAWAAVAVARWATDRYEEQIGSFLGALTIGVLGNLYARFRHKPALVVQMPGVLLLVPGSIGYRSLTQFLQENPLSGVEGAFTTGLIAASLAGGLLAANLVIPPRREL